MSTVFPHSIIITDLDCSLIIDLIWFLERRRIVVVVLWGGLFTSYISSLSNVFCKTHSFVYFSTSFRNDYSLYVKLLLYRETWVIKPVSVSRPTTEDNLSHTPNRGKMDDHPLI